MVFEASGVQLTVTAPSEAASSKVLVVIGKSPSGAQLLRAEGIVSELLEAGVDAEIVLAWGRFTALPMRDGYAPDVPFRYLQPANVSFEAGNWHTSHAEVFRSLLCLCRGFHPCVVLTLEDEVATALSLALPASIGLVSLFSGEKNAVSTAYAIGPELDRIVMPSSEAAQVLLDMNPALADRTMVLPRLAPLPLTWPLAQS